jgi:hypothetical protein
VSDWRMADIAERTLVFFFLAMPATSRSENYVEKKTCEFAGQPCRIADIPWTMGAGLAEIGFALESFTSSASILRCSCGWGRLIRVIGQLFHGPEQR